MKRNRLKRQIWFCSPKDLYIIGEELERYNVIQGFHFGSENVYEWLITDSTHPNIELNISRQHCQDGYGNPLLFQLAKEPISIIISYAEEEPDDNYVRLLAEKICNVLICEVSIGYIDYIGGDRYEYEQLEQIPIEYLIINDIRIDENEVFVGATNSQRWKADTEEYGMSGANATTIVHVALVRKESGYISEEAELYCHRGDPLRPLALRHLHELYEIAHHIKENNLDHKAASVKYFGHSILAIMQY